MIILFLLIIILIILTFISYFPMKNVMASHYGNNNCFDGIPKIIHRTWYSNELNRHMYNEAYLKWVTLNPEYTMIWHDNDNCKKFMKSQGKRVYKAWKKIIPTAYKADFWRACQLYETGGVYADSYTCPYTSINEMIKLTKLENDKDIFISVLDIKDSGSGIHNGFMMVTPKHPILKKYIKDMIVNIEKGVEKKIFRLTGPLCLSQSINNLCKDNKPHQLGYNDKLYKYFLFELNDGIYGNIYYNKKLLMVKKYDFLHCFLYQKAYKYCTGSTQNYLYYHQLGKVVHSDNSISSEEL